VKDQVIMGPSGEIAVAVPLFRYHHEEQLAKLEGYSVALTNGKPLAYIVDAGAVGTQLCSAEWLENGSGAEFLGDL
jgi:hypothetical protein